MSLSKRRFSIAITCILLVALCLTVRERPVLVHLFADTDCACSDYQQELSGFVLFNPLRNREPEVVATTFFEELRQGRCSDSTVLNSPIECKSALNGHRASAWQLAYRRDTTESVELFYRLISFDDPRLEFTGEGRVEARLVNGAWRVTSTTAFSDCSRAP